MEYDEYDGALDEYHRFETFIKEWEKHIDLCNKAADPCGEGFSLPSSLLHLYLVLFGEYVSDGKYPYHLYKKELMTIVEGSYCIGASDTLKNLREILRQFVEEDPSTAELVMKKHGCSYTLSQVSGLYHDLAIETYDALREAKEDWRHSPITTDQFLGSIRNEIDNALCYYDLLPFVYWTCAFEDAEKLGYVDNSWWEQFSHATLTEALETFNGHSEGYTERTRYYLDLAIRNIQFIGMPYMPVFIR